MHNRHLTRARTHGLSLSRSPLPVPLSPAPPPLRIEDRLGILLTPTNSCGNAWRPAFIRILLLSLLQALSGSLALIYYDILKQTSVHRLETCLDPLHFLSLCRCRFFLPALCGSLTLIYHILHFFEINFTIL